jgi:serine/threonine protein kinase
MEERNILALTSSSEWFTKLHASFHDERQLFLLMEYAPGGTLRSPMERPDRDEGPPLSEAEIKFYIASIVVGIEELHKKRYIHR